MEVNVRDAGDLGHLLAELLGDGEAALPVDADHLHVDGGGQAEVQDLAGDVRRLEEEGALREPPRQLLAQPGHVVRGGPVVRLQGHEDLAVGVADRAVIDVAHDREGLRHPHVVQDHGPLVVRHHLADGVLDLAEDLLRHFDAGAGRGPHVHPELAGVHAGEEVLADVGEQRQGTQREAEQDDGREKPVVEGPAEEALVKQPQPLEGAVEDGMEG